MKQVVAILKTLLILAFRVVTILTIGMIAGCTTATDNATEYFNRGNAHIENGEHDRAIADYTEAIRIKPDYAKAYTIVASPTLTKGEHDRAIADYTEAIRIKPDYAEAYHNRGVAYVRKVNTTAPSPTTRKPSGSGRTLPRRTTIVAGPTLRKASTTVPSPTTRKPSGSSRTMPRRTTIVALPTLTKASTTKPSPTTRKPSGSSRTCRGVLQSWLRLREKGEHDRAIADYTEAIRIRPDDAEAYYNRGSATVRKASTTAPSPTTRKPSGSSRTMPRRTTIVAVPTSRKASTIKPSPTGRKPSRSSRIMPRRTTVVALRTETGRP